MKHTFVNEIGNTISVECIWVDNVGEVKLLKYTMMGPDSMIENTITMKEAEELMDGLHQLIYGGHLR